MSLREPKASVALRVRGGDQRFESGFLQRGVRKLSVPLGVEIQSGIVGVVTP
jgi:hypothetical protein